MMKFFRKYNKQLLAVFMALLMIVFLGGSALDSLLQPSGNRVVAHTKVGDISYMDHEIANHTTSILGRIGFDWQRPLSGIREPLGVLDWVLLSREAEEFGMASSLAEVRNSLSSQLDVDRLSRQLGVKPNRILRAFAELMAIQQAALAVAGAAMPSEAEILNVARKSLEKVKIQSVLLPARAFVDEDAEFTEAEVEAQFAAYRDREPGEGLEFGYYVQPAVKVQYIKIERDVIAEQIRISKSRLLERKAKAYYDQRREQDPAFARPPEEMAVQEDEEELEGPPEEKPPYLTWEEASGIAMDIVSEQEAEQAVARIADWLVPQLAEFWLDVKRGEDGYRVAPEKVARLEHYDEMLEKIPSSAAYPGSVSTGVTDFFSQIEAGDVPMLGTAVFRAVRGGRPESLRTLTFRTKATVPDLTKQEGINPSDYRAVFETFRYPLTDSDGNVYIARVIDIREGHIPESVAEVRERVLDDLRLLDGFETAKARAESLRSCTASIDLQEAYESDEELAALTSSQSGAGGGFFQPPPFGRASLYQAARGGLMETTYVGGGIGNVPSDVVDDCFALAEADDKTKVVELRDRATVMIIEWLETEPVRAEEFDDMRERLVSQVLRFRSQAAIADWFDSDQIRARNGYEIATN